MTKDRKAELFNAVVDWVWEHTEGFGEKDYLLALEHCGFTEEEQREFCDNYDEIKNTMEV